MFFVVINKFHILERGRRIELLALAWKAKVLPLYEPRIELVAQNLSHYTPGAMASYSFGRVLVDIKSIKQTQSSFVHLIVSDANEIASSVIFCNPPISHIPR